ncbi:MAG TPA: hypothetical protein VII94_04590 [Candidatus Saccharimonadales bacterium]
MYKCMITGEMSEPGDKLNKIVAGTRERVYTRWVRNEETNKWEEVFVSRGWEITRELNATDDGVKLWESYTSEERAAFLKHM